MQHRNISIYGPYSDKDRGGFRIVVNTRGGSRTLRYPTKGQAEAIKQKLLAQATRKAALTAKEALGDYLAYLRNNKGCSVRHAETTEQRIVGFLGESLLEAPVVKLNANKVTEALAAYRSGHAFVTSRGALGQTRTFFKWCVSKGYHEKNFAEGLTIEGKANKGKRQLRVNEARQLVGFLWKRLTEYKEDQALAVLITLYMGLRASETIRLKAESVDDNGRLLWVDGTKTLTSQGTLETPEQLWEPLSKVASGKLPEERLFPHRREWLRIWTRKYCKDAGVSIISPQSLRGMHATLATYGGASTHLVAATLRHSPEVTRAHYLDPKATRQAGADRVAQVLPFVPK